MIKKITSLMLVTIFLASNVVAFQKSDNLRDTSIYELEDIDPLVDLQITVTIKEIRALDKIDLFNEPDFYVNIFINDVEHVSPVWLNQKYIKSNWSVTQDVPDDEEYVNIKIQLWDQNFLKDKICDISRNDQSDPNSYDVDLIYSLKTGHWRGDDYIHSYPLFSDPSGYGRLNGCDDNSIYKNDRDCELWFDITQTDYDGDGIPYWTEVNVINTDPKVDDRTLDPDEDGCPSAWEWRWGYDPNSWDDHRNLDTDVDGLDNIEEYLTSEWGSDPFRQDIFLELDQMEIGPNNMGGFVPEESKNIIVDAFSKHNIVFHIIETSELIPFDENTTDAELQDLYRDYFLDGDPDNWKRGAMHYGLIIYHSTRYGGFVFPSDVNGKRFLDCFQVSTKYIEIISKQSSFLDKLIRRWFTKEQKRVIVYAGAIMHETGHTLGIFGWNTPGCDSADLKWVKYRSCMSYLYIYYRIDYSDGRLGKNDFDDWSNLDLTFFQREVRWH